MSTPVMSVCLLYKRHHSETNVATDLPQLRPESASKCSGKKLYHPTWMGEGVEGGRMCKRCYVLEFTFYIRSKSGQRSKIPKNKFNLPVIFRQHQVE